MFIVTKDEEFVCVSVKLSKRVLSKQPKVYIYDNDALLEAKKMFPELNFSQKPEKSQVISSVSTPHEGTWMFRIVKPKKQEQPQKQEQKKSLTLTQNVDKVGGDLKSVETGSLNK